MSQIIRSRKIIYRIFNTLFLKNKFKSSEDVIHIYNDIVKAIEKNTKSGPFTSAYSSPLIMRFNFCELQIVAQLILDYICNCYPTAIGDAMSNKFLDNLFLNYRMNEISGSGIQDQTPYNRDLILQGAGYTRNAPKIRLNGTASTNFTSTSKADTNVAFPEILAHKTLSASVWFRHTISSNGGYIFGGSITSDATASVNYQFALNILTGNTLGVFWENGLGSNNQFNTGFVLVTGTAYHIVVVKDSDNKRLTVYVNGQQIYTTIYVNEPTGGEATPFTVGNNNNPENLPANGDISDLSMWTRIITPCEILLLYNSGKGLDYNQYQ